MKPQDLLVGIFLVVALLFVTSCSLLSKQPTSQSNIPSAANLKQICAAGPTQTPPVARPGACDDYNTIQAGCIALTAQPLIPAQALQLCIANGYVVSGTFTPL